MKKCSEVT